MKLIEHIHADRIEHRRARALSNRLADIIPDRFAVLERRLWRRFDCPPDW